MQFFTDWPCLACGDNATNHSPLCAACQQQLPWNYTACVQCATPMPSQGQRCGACQKRPPSVDISIVPLLYQDAVQHFIQQFKFERRLEFGPCLAELMLTTLQQLPEDSLPDAIVPVPLHHKRVRQRGYDQTLEVGRLLAKRLNRPLLEQAIERVKFTAPLHGLKPAQRRKVIRNAFAVKQPLPKHIALLDDVMTTGSTLYECARTAKQAGVDVVQAWAVARTSTGMGR